MKLKVVNSSHLVFQAFVPSLLSSLSDPFVSKTHSKPHMFNKISEGHHRAFRTSCSSNLDGIEGLANKNVHYAKESPFLGKEDMNMDPRLDFMEARMMFETVKPHWSNIETATIERKAKSFDIPLSLRMIKKKLQYEKCLKNFEESAVRRSITSMVFIVSELHSFALASTGALRDEDLAISRKEIQSSFAWIFEHVFSTTPSFMLHVMTLLADFSLHSASPGIVPSRHELSLDVHKDYIQTNNQYHMALWEDPMNPLLLCNYARFLVAVGDDYDMAEEWFKRSVDVSPPDAESRNQYADFLWMVRKDHTRAEEMYQEAMSIEPDNNYYSSRYADFLWSTRGEETCVPLNSSQYPNL